LPFAPYSGSDLSRRRIPLLLLLQTQQKNTISDRLATDLLEYISNTSMNNELCDALGGAAGKGREFTVAAIAQRSKPVICL